MTAGWVMKLRDQSRLETLVGFGAVLALVGAFAFLMDGRQESADSGYPVHAAFSHIDGLGPGSDVRIAGIKVGTVEKVAVNPKTYQADVLFSVGKNIALPDDSGAVITSDSLLGGKYIALSPGGSEHEIRPGGVIVDTQGSISLEQLLSKFIFSVSDSLSKLRPVSGGGGASSGSAQPGAGS